MIISILIIQIKRYMEPIDLEMYLDSYPSSIKVSSNSSEDLLEISSVIASPSFSGNVKSQPSKITWAFKYGISKTAMWIIYFNTSTTKFGKWIAKSGKWVISWIPLIIAQTWDKAAFVILCTTVLNSMTVVVAAVIDKAAY